MQMPAPEADGDNGTVTDHVAARQAERLDVGTALGKATDGCTVQQSAAFQVHNTQPSAVREDITQHWSKGGRVGGRQMSQAKEKSFASGGRFYSMDWKS